MPARLDPAQILLRIEQSQVVVGLLRFLLIASKAYRVPLAFLCARHVLIGIQISVKLLVEAIRLSCCLLGLYMPVLEYKQHELTLEGCRARGRVEPPYQLVLGHAHHQCPGVPPLLQSGPLPFPGGCQAQRCGGHRQFLTRNHLFLPALSVLLQEEIPRDLGLEERKQHAGGLQRRRHGQVSFLPGPLHVRGTLLPHPAGGWGSQILVGAARNLIGLVLALLWRWSVGTMEGRRPSVSRSAFSLAFPKDRN